ncbi:hypothetical protein DFH09DRAFT_1447329 [Mycena vulgaris]|nr:hypothetical protein DFH09DRAFT_1447329 [Mycena vulgaris]
MRQRKRDENLLPSDTPSSAPVIPVFYSLPSRTHAHLHYARSLTLSLRLIRRLSRAGTTPALQPAPACAHLQSRCHRCAAAEEGQRFIDICVLEFELESASAAHGIHTHIDESSDTEAGAAADAEFSTTATSTKSEPRVLAVRVARVAAAEGLALPGGERPGAARACGVVGGLAGDVDLVGRGRGAPAEGEHGRVCGADGGERGGGGEGDCKEDHWGWGWEWEWEWEGGWESEGEGGEHEFGARGGENTHHIDILDIIYDDDGKAAAFAAAACNDDDGSDGDCYEHEHGGDGDGGGGGRARGHGDVRARGGADDECYGGRTAGGGWLEWECEREFGAGCGTVRF